MSAARPLIVRDLVETEFESWNRLLLESPDASIYSTPEYLDVLCGTAGGRFRIVGVWAGEDVVAGIAVYERRYWYGAYAGPRPLLYYHSPVLRRYPSKYPSQQTARHVQILGALAEHLAGATRAGVVVKCRHTIMDVRPFLSAGWHATPSYSYVVPLDGLEEQWGRVEQNLRRLVRRCDQKGLVAAEDDDVGTFHRMHRATMARKGAEPYLTREAFGRYFERLRARDLCRLYHARLPDGQRVAGLFVLLGPGNVSHTVMAVADEAYLGLGVSAFLRWKVFELLSALGYTGNDLTDAALNSVTHFKSQLGGSLELCHVLHRSPSRPRRLAKSVDALRGRIARLAAGGARRIRMRRDSKMEGR